ncbi:MAG: bacteriohopanetetrol glucosamine biosynthesis glycosyltransferase HpnI [Gammaproteobacteria bacterium]|nr:bacteriohopanetetrol glucosamine biosynthesis glycosyltransferase HpnI [Gammaproteobacteria bacterium]
MSTGLGPLAAGIGLALSTVSLLYVAGAIAALLAWGRRRVPLAPQTPPVTILKPLCGAEPELYENLRSFCDQDYPEFQVVFGARDADDPALAVARRLVAEFPHRDLSVVADPRTIGTNHKVSNLANLLPAARHEYLVIADSDIRVGPDYLRSVVGPLLDPGVGVVTCLYRGRALGPVWSRLGALFINEGFLPSVLVARALGSSAFSFGSTLALRRAALDQAGGLPALASHLADDYQLGALTRRQGLRTVLSPYLVETLAHEPSAARLLHHELRWGRTIRTIQPWGYFFSGVTYALPMSLIGAGLAAPRPWALALPLLALALRLMLHYAASAGLRLSNPPGPWLVPFRDLLSFAVWSGSFLGRRVRWRRGDFSVQSDGRMRANKESL